MAIDRTALLDRASALVGQWLEHVAAAKSIEMASLPVERTALIIVDMVNGFAREGALASPRVEALIPAIARLQEQAKERGLPILAFGDSHPADSLEFNAYPPHCIVGTTESELVAELATVGGYQFFPKNSTNGCIEPAFQSWLVEHPAIDQFIVVGDCTDICILQFALTLKTQFNRQNRASRIIVPINGVDTFDAPNHDGDLLHVAAINIMIGNGIEVVSQIE